MKTSTFLCLSLGATLLLQACNSNNNTSDDKDSASIHADTSAHLIPDTSTGITDTAAKAFMNQAAIGGMMEVEAGKIAQEKASKAAVKAFGAKMVQDHTKAGDELKALAASKGITLPAALPEMEQKHLDAMKGMSGIAFDKHYMSMMVNDHGKTIDLFEQATMSTVPEVKSWAEKTLPVLKGHNEMAGKIYAEIK
jgi:putative membrane protein